MHNFSKLMMTKSNAELIQIITTDRVKFKKEAVEAAEKEIINRNFDEILTNELIEKVS